MSFLRNQNIRGTVGFAERLELLRVQNGLSQSDLARALWGQSKKVSAAQGRMSISRWERGKARPTAENLKKLSKYFGVPVKEFELGLFVDKNPKFKESGEVSVLADGSVFLDISRKMDPETAEKILALLK